MDTEVKVVVLSRNYSTGLSVIRSLGEAGFTVDLIACTNRKGEFEVAAASKYVNNYVEIVSDKIERNGDDGIVDELLKYRDCKEKLILIPTDDYTASLVDNSKDILKKIFMVPEIIGSREGKLTQLMNKSVQSEIAKGVGFDTAKNWIISLRNKEILIPEDIVFPCFCKPIESIFGFKTEMAKCESLEELKAHLEKVRDRYSDRDFLVQEFLEIDCEYELDGICIDQNVIVPAVSRNIIVGEYGKGIPVFGELVSINNLGKIKGKIVSILQKLHYFGLFDMQILEVGGKFYFNEINLRSGGPIYAYTASGANLPRIFVEEILWQRHNPKDEHVESYGKKYFYEKVGWQDFFKDNISLERVRKCEKNADIFFIADDSDPKPGEIFRNMIERKLANREAEAREKCVCATMAATGWDEDTAKNIVIKRKRALGISYRNYKKYNFHLIPESKQKDKFIQLQYELDNTTGKERKKISVMDKADIQILVLSRGYATGLSVARSLGAAGYTVDMISSVRKKGLSEIAASSKYIRNFTEVIARKIDDFGEEKVIDALLEGRYYGEIKPIIFPTDDYSVSIIDGARDILDKYFNMPFVKGDSGYSLVDKMDKSFQSSVAKEVGMLTPKEWVVSLNSDILVPEDIEYPVFCKPNESFSGFKREMSVCENEEELIAHLTRLRKRKMDRSVLIQEFLNIDTEIDFSGLCIDQEIIIPAIIKKTAVAQYEKGITLAGVLRPFDELGDIQEKVIEMLKQFHYTGMFDMELNVVGDKIYFNEVNLRSGGPNYSYFASGVNLPELFIKAMLHMDYSKEETKVNEYGKSFVYEKVAFDDYMAGMITKRQLNEYINKADITLMYNEDDPEPSRQFKELLGKTAKKKRRKNNIYSKTASRMLRNINSMVQGYPQNKRKNARNSKSEVPRILVAGRNYSTNLGIARALGEAGYEVEIMRVYQHKPRMGSLMRELKPDAYSKYVKGYYICVSHHKNSKIVKKLKAIADPDRKMLIIPGDDLVAAAIDSFYYELEDLYIMPKVEGKYGEIRKYMSKELQKELARKAGLPVLNSCKIQTINRKYEIPDNLTFPCFVKPDVSFQNKKSTMKMCNNKQELREHFDLITEKKDRAMFVEDFVEIKNEYSILGLGTRDGVIGPALFVAEKGGAGRRRGVAITGRILSTDEMQPLVAKLIDFVASIGFEGLYDIDLIETTDGDVYFVEINMRIGTSGYAFTKCGLNLPGMYADYMLKGILPDKNIRVIEDDKTFVNEKELLDAYIDDIIDDRTFKEIMDSTDIHFIDNLDDPKPYKHFKRKFRLATEERKKRKFANIDN